MAVKYVGGRWRFPRLWCSRRWSGPALLDPVAAAWTIVLRPMQQAVTIAAMAMLFFLVITPAGWLRRLLVHDPLRLRFDGRATSYWQKRQTPSAETMMNQF
jgi:hypothetical protein